MNEGLDLNSGLLGATYPGWENQWCQYVCERKQRFKELIDIFYGPDPRLLQRSTLIILACNNEKPQWVDEQVPRMVKTLSKEIPASLKRNILRILQFKQIPKKLWGHLADVCFDFLASTDEPVVVKAFSMTVLYNLTRHLPDLGRELRFLIEEQYALGSAGIKARGRRVLGQLTRDGL